MTNGQNSKYDLEERTAKFGEGIIKFCQDLSKNTITIPIISQLIRAGTAVGGLYCEADDAESIKDFRHKLGICKKEAREVKHRLRMMVTAVSECREQSLKLWQEAKELNLIFNAIIRKLDQK